jgi:hypothetical protein
MLSGEDPGMNLEREAGKSLTTTDEHGHHCEAVCSKTQAKNQVL